MQERDAQTAVYDDFEKSLLDGGFEVVYPREETEDDIAGAGEYPPRLTAPTDTNPYYLRHSGGGFNRCIEINNNSCLPNGVGYAHGRILEIGAATGNNQLPTCNAVDWITTAEKNGLQTGKEPMKGAAIVWECSKPYGGADYGHIGVVEAIEHDGSITVSQSSYGGSRFYLSKHKPPYDIPGYTCIGFVYNPYIGSGSWAKDETGWWYQKYDGTFPVSQWMMVNNRWYHFDSKGYMQTGWLATRGGMSYLREDGSAVSGWQFIDAKWYFFDKDCYMKTGWVKDKGRWYYLKKDGTLLSSSWIQRNDKWHYLGRDGAMVTGKHTVAVFFDDNGNFIGSPK